MKEIQENLWQKFNNRGLGYTGICITTNGIVKKDGSLVMGKGIAYDAAKRWPWLPKRLGFLVTLYGNVPHLIRQDGFDIISFPTKKHFSDNSDLDLIEESCQYILELVRYWKLYEILLPRPGCGYGNLKWKNVKPILEKYFDNRFIVCNKQGI